MNPGFSDPNNHVPGVSKNDGWDDADDTSPVVRLAPSALPPRRSSQPPEPLTIEPRTLEKKPMPGLRITSPDHRAPSQEEPLRLEVQEINSAVVRLEKEIPAPPKVERVITFHERPNNHPEKPQNRGEADDWGQVQQDAHHKPHRWILMMGAAIIALVVLGIAALPWINAPNAGRMDSENSPAAVAEEKQTPVDLALIRLLSRQPEAIQIYHAFLTASHPDEMVPFLRDEPDMKAALLERWQPPQISNQWEIASDSGWEVTELEGHACAILTGFLPDNSEFRAYFIFDNDQLRLDWKATTAYGTARFEALEKGKGNPGEIRGEISIADFYTQDFPEETYQAFRLISPDGQSLIWCYAARDSGTYAAIAHKLQVGPILQEAVDSKKVTLRLKRGPDGTSPNQWLIQDLLQIDWVSR